MQLSISSSSVHQCISSSVHQVVNNPNAFTYVHLQLHARNALVVVPLTSLRHPLHKMDRMPAPDLSELWLGNMPGYMDETAVRIHFTSLWLPMPDELRVKQGTGEREGQNYAFARYNDEQEKNRMLNTLFKWPGGRLCLCKQSMPAKKRRTSHPPPKATTKGRLPDACLHFVWGEGVGVRCGWVVVGEGGDPQ